MYGGNIEGMYEDNRVKRSIKFNEIYAVRKCRQGIWKYAEIFLLIQKLLYKFIVLRYHR